MQLTRIASMLLLCTGIAAAQSSFAPADTSSSAAPKAPAAPQSFDLTAIDKSADPCTDFYQYACGNWRKDHPIPGDQSRWGRFNELGERNRYLLYVDLKQAADSPKTPLQKQYGDFFASCMNTDEVDKLGDKPVLPLLEQVDGLSGKGKLAALVAQLQAQEGARAFFAFGVEQDEKDSTKQIADASQGGLTLPDRDYYLLDDARMTKIRAEYKDYVVSMFKLVGDDDAKAKAEAESVLTIETALAKGSTPRVDLRDPDKRYHPMPVSGLKTLAPDFDWNSYLSGIHAPSLATLNVATPDFFKAMNGVIAEQSMDGLKSYLRFHVINSAAPWMSTPFADANFGFFQKTLRGQAEQTARWKRCTTLTDGALGEAVGQDWVKQNFPPDAKANMEKLVAALRKALAEDIQQLPWMTEATKKQAELKLDAFRQKIGYPEKWRDYSALEVKRDDLLGNIRRSDAFEFQWDLGHIGKPVNEKEWVMTPPTVNAYYDPSMNDINFPAGILQPPFYDYTKDPAVNFGAIGVVIGHEMTHGFDDEGSKYDAQGNVKNWWTPADRTAFDAKTDCEVKEYGSFEPVPGQKLNGKLTLGENTADNGGIHIAYQALLATLAQDHIDPNAKIDGYTAAQRFFISFAQVWCENRTDQYARVAARTDPHSPGMFRTNGTVQNSEEFGKAFGCHLGQPMMPKDACRVW
ncbi:MAG: M13 family metallopeptidase [Acidobacteria bacterium]|nr:M13 family metallopeptidase [Acidobacteriota bacterium]MBW4045474.1 M13 family metallopeptidase [Acidobacteriota bacterium]